MPIFYIPRTQQSLSSPKVLLHWSSQTQHNTSSTMFILILALLTFRCAYAVIESHYDLLFLFRIMRSAKFYALGCSSSKGLLARFSSSQSCQVCTICWSPGDIAGLRSKLSCGLWNAGCLVIIVTAWRFMRLLSRIVLRNQALVIVCLSSILLSNFCSYKSFLVVFLNRKKSQWSNLLIKVFLLSRFTS